MNTDDRTIVPVSSLTKTREEKHCPSCGGSTPGDAQHHCTKCGARLPLSPTQIKAFARCVRMWGFDYVEGFRGTDSRFTDFGKKVHKQAEAYFKECKLPDTATEEGKVFESGLHHWPPPQEATGVEFEIHAELDGFRYHGFQDIEFLDTVCDGTTDENGDDYYFDLPIVGDHKSTSDFKWALDAKGLREDVQANIYLLAAMQRHNTPYGEARWVYYRTRGTKKSLLVTENGKPVLFTWDQVIAFMREHVAPYAEAIHQWYESKARALDMPPNVEACDDFGGCAHLERCGMTALERMKALMAHDNLKSKLQARQAAKAAGVNPPESAAPAPQPTLPVGRPVSAAPAPSAAPATNVVPLAQRMRKGPAPAAPAPAAPTAPSATPPVVAQPPAPPATPAGAIDPVALTRKLFPHTVTNDAAPTTSTAPAPAVAVSPAPSEAPPAAAAAPRTRAPRTVNTDNPTLDAVVQISAILKPLSKDDAKRVLTAIEALL